MDCVMGKEHRKTWANTKQTILCRWIYVKHDKSMEYPVENIVSTTINFAALKAISSAFTPSSE